MSESIGPIRMVVARKHHECDACHWLNVAGLRDDEYEPDDLLIVQAARADRWKIRPGERYQSQTVIHEGRIQTVRYKPPIAAICDKYELWPDV